MMTEHETKSQPQSPTNLNLLSEQGPAGPESLPPSIPTFSADVVEKNLSKSSLDSNSRKDTTPKGKRSLPPIPLDPPITTVRSEKSTGSSKRQVDPNPEPSESFVSSSTTPRGSPRTVPPPDSMPHTRSDHHHSSSTRRSKHGSGRHRRLLAELFHLYPQLNQHSSERTEPAGSSFNGIHTSPTDSHSRRTHSQPYHQSSSSISDVLIMTTEKLHIETTRANAAEKQIADVMSLFKNTHDQKLKLEGELSRIRGELGWYKVQLDVAQKEIFRAQEIVERVDRQRVEAEEAAVRAREKSRKISEARAVDLALEEGRRAGFEEGLKHGRLMAQLQDSKKSRSKSLTTSSGGSGSRKSQPVAQSEPLSETSKAYKPSASKSQRPPSRAQAPTTTTTQPAVDQKRGRRLSRPEEIAIQNSDPIPISKSNYKQSPSRRSVILPPDNYIPVLNADSMMITLPPPHELTLPIPPEGPSSFPPRTPRAQTPSNRPRSNSKPMSVRSTVEPPPPSHNLADISAPVPRRAVSPMMSRDEPANSVPKVAPEFTEPRSPTMYPSRPPRRPREIVMPMPLGNQFLSATTITNGGMPRVVNPPESATTNDDPQTPTHGVRMGSITTIPGISVETPSSKSARSERSILNPVLLTPEHANKVLPSHEAQKNGEALGLLYADPSKVSTPKQLPPSFIPLSPIPGMANLNPYPVGLNPKDQSGAKDVNFVYPSSPLARPT